MNAWQRLAWMEWYRSTRGTSQDNHDFFWLVVLLWLTLTLALLLWGSREGLLNKFVEVSLGNLADAGIPIWIAANNLEGIDRQLLQQTQIKLYPYREVESSEVALPNIPTQKPVWGEKTTFAGWAVSSEDPLWQLSVKTNPATTASTIPPLTIILNKSLFTQYFNCAAYLEALQSSPTGNVVNQAEPSNVLQLPPAGTVPQLSSKEETLACLANNILWLEVKVGTERRELLPFQIYWQPRIPTMHQLAFLLPLSTWHTLQVSNYFTNLRYYPEAQIEKTPRIKELMVWHGNQPWQGIETLRNCLGPAEVKGDRITLNYPLPRPTVLHCIQHSGISLVTGHTPAPPPPYLTITEESNSHYFQYDHRDYLTIFCDQNHRACQPCQNLLPSPAWHGLPHTICTDQYTTADMVELVGSYQKALTYVKNRADLARYLKQIQQIPQTATDPRPAFYLHPTYQDALIRFLFIQTVIDLLKMVYTPLLLLCLIILLTVQIGIVITHRQHNYGILLAKGLSWQQLYQMILLQITWSFLVAIGIAILIIQTVRHWLSREVATLLIQKPYIDHLLVNDLDLLPLSVLDYTTVGIITLATSYLITTLLFRQIVTRRQVEPAYLFK